MNISAPMQAGAAGGIGDIDLGPNGSVQIMFAKLQLMMSAQCKTQAENYMHEVESIQSEQKKTAEMVALARMYKDKGMDMPPELRKFMDDRKLPIKGGRDQRDWDFNIKSLTNYQETVGNKTQTLMVYLQDFIGQYNSYLQGASSSINDAKNVLSAIARGQ